MAKQTRPTLKGYFETGDIPSQAQYADLIDSNLNLSENNTGDIQLTGNLTASGDISSSATLTANEANIVGNITASGNISASGTILANKIESDQLVSHIGDANTGLQFADDTVIIEGNDVIAARFSSTAVNLNKDISNTLGTDVVINDSLKVNQELNVLSHVTASGNISSSIGTGSFGSLVVDGSSVDFSGLPTSDPGVAGRLYNDSGTIKISL